MRTASNTPFRKRGNAWYFRIKLPGSDGIMRWTERKGGRTKAECQASYLELKARIEGRGHLPTTGRITVRDLFETWFSEYVDLNTKYQTQRSYRGTIAKHIYATMGTLDIQQITPRYLQQFINQKSGEMKRSSLGRLLALMKSAFGYGVNPCEYLDASPADKVRLPRDIDAEPHRVHVFSHEDMAAIEERFPPGHQYYIAIHICYYTGLRIGEALGLRWQDVDLDSQELTVNGTMTDRGVRQDVPKTKNSFRTIPFGGKLHEILCNELQRQSEASCGFRGVYNPYHYVCCRPKSGYRMTGTDFHYFNEWCKETLGGGSTHSLRHTHATMLLEAGQSLEVVSKRLGHSTVVTTSKFYSHITSKGNTKMRSTLDALFPPGGDGE